MNDFEWIKQLRENLPAPRPESRDAARAALVARFEAADATTSQHAPRRVFRVRNLALAGTLAAVAAALLIVLGAGGGSGAKPEVASAADLTQLTELAPHFEIAGGWQITHTEVSPDGGGTQFHYEGDPSRADGTSDAEIRWHTASVEELGKQLEDEGFEAAGTQPTRTTDAAELRADNVDGMFTSGTAQVYVSREEGESFFGAVGVWREEGWTLELSARVQSLYMLERLLERVEILGSEEWLVAIRPGGAKWLKDSMYGTVKRVENVKTEMPDGQVVYETRFIAKSSEEDEKLEFTSPFPVIYREGDNVRVEVEQVPSEVSESP
jgi:hypothetical protein